MTEDGRGQSTVVTLEGCRCPGGPHQSDTVTLHPTLTTPMGVAGLAAVRDGGSSADVQGRLAEVWLHWGIADWSFIDEKGQPVPVTADNVERLLPFADGGFEVADAADTLYAEALFRPLAKRLSRLSPPTPTDDSTSARSPSGPSSPTPSRRSRQPESAGSPSEVPAP